MERTKAEFASRHAHSGYSYDHRSSHDLALPGWGARSRWGVTGSDPWVRLRHDTDRSRDTDLGVEPGRTGGSLLVVLALVEELDVEPEDAVRAMGVAAPGMLVRPRDQIARSLADAPDVGAELQGRRAALTWLAGGSQRRPGSERCWDGGEPDRYQVDAEYQMTLARLARGGLEPQSVKHLEGVRDALSWARLLIGPLCPRAGESERWLRRRWRRVPDDPAPDVPAVRGSQQGPDGGQGWGPRVIRARRFRSWLVLHVAEVVGRVEPLSRRRWVATDPSGQRLDDVVHPTLSDAAFDVVTTALRAGRIDFDSPD